MTRLQNRPNSGWGVGFALWFAFCALLGVAFVGALIWLLVAATSWLNRQP